MHNEDSEPYLRFMRERYGAGVVEELEGIKNSRDKVTDEDMLHVLERLRALA
jgi:hypothetical protein